MLQESGLKLQIKYIMGKIGYLWEQTHQILPASLMLQSVRSISLRSGQQEPIWSRPFSVIREQDSNRRHSSFLQWSDIADRALSVRRSQHVRSIVLRSLQLDTSSQMPSSFTPWHLLRLISINFLQLRPITWRLEAVTWNPSSFKVFKVVFKTLSFETKSGARS